MIKSKTPQIVDAQNGTSAIVFFRCNHSVHDRENGLRLFNIQTLIEVTEGGQTGLRAISESKAIYKEATFQALFGSKSLAQFELEFDSLMIEQIDYINNVKEWNGTEPQKPVRFWNLSANDLEIHIPQ